MKIGIYPFLHWEMVFRSLGLGFESEKSQNGNGIGVLLAYQWDGDTG